MDEKVAQSDTDGGSNTKSPRRRRWCFTVNNPEEKEIFLLVEFLAQMDYVFQEEIGESGTRHLQGTFSSKNPIRFSRLKKLIPRAHWEPCRDWKASIKYCSDPNKRSGKIWKSTNLVLPRPVQDVVKSKGANFIQRYIKSIAQTVPDDRTIYWIYDREGGSGKTALCRHLCLNFGAIMVGGKGNDIKYAIAQHIEKNNVDIVLINLTRQIEDYVSYDAIEQVKDGIFFSGKYESGQIIMNSPHIFVFANCEPSYEKLTSDRWHVIDVEMMKRFWRLIGNA